MSATSDLPAGPPPDLDSRTKQFALRIIRLYEALPNTVPAQIIGTQLLRSGTSVGAHYREARRAKSNPDFISLIQGGLKELDETAYWMELLQEAEIVPVSRLGALLKETSELIAIFYTIIRNAKSRNSRSRHP
jgi:four helix bundle protein